MRRPKHLKNIAGIVIAFVTQVFGVLFGIWQFDMMVSGCVWWGNATQGWSYPFRYANEYFQCFLWRTTIGQAYDTLLTIIFLSAVLPSILLFISVWYWTD